MTFSFDQDTFFNAECGCLFESFYMVNSWNELMGRGNGLHLYSNHKDTCRSCLCDLAVQSHHLVEQLLNKLVKTARKSECRGNTRFPPFKR